MVVILKFAECRQTCSEFELLKWLPLKQLHFMNPNHNRGSLAFCTEANLQQTFNWLKRLTISCVIKCVSSNCIANNLRTSKAPLWGTGSYNIAQKPRFYRKKTSAKPDFESSVSLAVRQQAQAALLDYLHYTRSLQFMDAEHISRSCPHFLEKLLTKIEITEDIRRSMARFLRYHPINEFEPFFESIGLKPSDYSSLLPRDIFFLSDDPMLMENYQVLCNYGIARDKLGKVYKEATAIFRYDKGVLESKLQSLQKIGLNQYTVIKVVSSSPHVLVGSENEEFLEALKKLKDFGIHYNWIGRHLVEEHSYNWAHMLDLLCIFNKIGDNKELLGSSIRQCPGLLIDVSGTTTFALIVLLLKFGCKINEISSILLQFQKLQVGKFVRNLRQGCHFLIEAEMEAQEIGKIVRSRTALLGSCSLKKLNSILSNLNTGKKRLCEIIKCNPEVLKSWVLGSKIRPLPDSGEEERSQMMKMKFLSDLGFTENSSEMRKALQGFRGKGLDLQERFDCLVNAGLKPEDVCEIVKAAPQILNQSKDVIEMKIDFLVNGLGYPVSSIVAFPTYLSYRVQRVKLRCNMYNWLKGQGIVDTKLALSTILASSEKIFVNQYVNRHPSGSAVWEKMQKEIHSE